LASKLDKANSHNQANGRDSSPPDSNRNTVSLNMASSHSPANSNMASTINRPSSLTNRNRKDNSRSKASGKDHGRKGNNNTRSRANTLNSPAKTIPSNTVSGKPDSMPNPTSSKDSTANSQISMANSKDNNLNMHSREVRRVTATQLVLWIPGLSGVPISRLATNSNSMVGRNNPLSNNTANKLRTNSACI